MQVKKRPTTSRQRPIARSTSLFGAIKNIVGWFSNTADGDVADAQGKRKEAGGRRESDEEERGRKRKRIESPDREITQERESNVGTKQRQTQMYRSSSTSASLDPPSTLLEPSVSRNLVHGRSASLAAPPRHHPYSHSMSPPPPSYHANALTRTQSMDPPPRRRLVLDSSTTAPSAQPLERDASMSVDPESSTANNLLRDVTRSPSKHFRMRTSLTPQPTGQGFGPHPQRRDRLPSEPPPLAALVDKPVFLRAPKDQGREAGEGQRVSQGSLTLGTIAESRRPAQPTQRSFSSLHIGSDSSVQDGNDNVYPITAAERALRELELYKTPLLPTRLRGSITGGAGMFKTKTMQAPVLMKDREKKPRLGTADRASPRKRGDKLKEMEEETAKPYAGKGGMKKLLEKRKQEEEQEGERREREEERNDKSKGRMIDEDDDMEERPQRSEQIQPPAPAPQELGSPKKLPLGGREQSSLRVGRARISKTIARPQAKGLRGAGGRFSANYEDEEGDDVMDEERRELEEAAKKAPVFNIPPGFSFAKDNAPVPPISQDASAKEPPIASLPFSLTKPTAPVPTTPAKSLPFAFPSTSSQSATTKASTSTANGLSFSAPTPATPVTVTAESAPVLAPAPSTPIINTIPAISLIPPTPGTPLATASKSTTSGPEQPTTTSDSGDSGVPNFFKGSSLFKAPTPQVNASSFSLFGAPSAKSGETAPAAPKLADMPPLGLSTATSDVSMSSQPSSTTPQNLFSAPTVSNPSANEIKPAEPAQPSPFGWPSASSTAAPSGGTQQSKPSAPATTAPPAPSTSFSFGGVTMSPAPTSSLPFSFGTKTSGTSPAPAASAPTSAPFSFGAKSAESPVTSTSSSNPFTFGAPKTEAPKEPKKPAVSAATPFTFGASPSPAPPEPPKSPFVFSAPSSAAPAPAATPSPVIQAPKPLFGGSTGFSFGQSAAPSTAAPEAPKSPFTFGGTPAPEERKPSFTFGSPSPAPPSNGPMLFDGAPAGTNGADASKPFTFGAPAVQTPTRPSTPPKTNGDSEVMMDESPGKLERPPAPISTGFSFGSGSSTGPFGSASTGSSSGAAPFAFGNSTGASNPFGSKTDAKSAFSAPTATATATSTPFSFGSKPAEPASSAPFSFGTKPAESSAPSNPFTFGPKPAEPAAAPTSGGPFSFNSPVTPTIPSAPFSFGAPQIAPSTSFGAASAPSAPASPNPFGQPSAGTSGPAFAFGAPNSAGAGATSTPTSTTAPTNPFTFGGSQPASPATTSIGLPGSSGGPFTFGAPSSAASSPFGTSAPLPPPSGGGALFNIGSAPPPTPGGTRAMKKLPNRRGGVKR